MARLIVRDFMTTQPVTIGAAQTLAAAHRLMREHEIRHLPVLSAGKVVGLVSMRDLHLVETFGDADPDSVPVEDAMTAEPYCVSPLAHLENVARQMAEHKFGSAVVCDHERVVGMFTTVDALRALATVLGDGATDEATDREPRSHARKSGPRAAGSTSTTTSSKARAVRS